MRWHYIQEEMYLSRGYSRGDVPLKRIFRSCTSQEDILEMSLLKSSELLSTTIFPLLILLMYS